MAADDPQGEEARRDAQPDAARRRRLAAALVGLVVLAGAVVSLVAALGGDDDAGDPVPDQKVATFDGEPVTLTDYEGQPLVLNFFASWCPPCVAEMRDALEPAHRELGGEVAFLGVANQDTTEAALEVVETTGVTYDLAEDPDGELFRALGATSMPATFYIDADGRVVGRHMGALTRDQLREQIDANLLEP